MLTFCSACIDSMTRKYFSVFKITTQHVTSPKSRHFMNEPRDFQFHKTAIFFLSIILNVDNLILQKKNNKKTNLNTDNF